MIQIEISGNKRTMNNAINEITVAEFEQLCVILNGDDQDIFDRYLRVFAVLGLSDEEIDIITPNEFIARRKIIHACHLLKDTRMNCKEIAFAVGYETPANFIRAFKGYQKTTPLQFRKNGVIPIY